MWSLEDGLEQLSETIGRRLASDSDSLVDVKKGTTCTGLQFDDNVVMVSSIFRFVLAQ